MCLRESSPEDVPRAVNTEEIPVSFGVNNPPGQK
jgi:hypothetical protein